MEDDRLVVGGLHRRLTVDLRLAVLVLVRALERRGAPVGTGVEQAQEIPGRTAADYIRCVNALQSVLDVLSGDRGAVVELDTIAQRVLEGLEVCACLASRGCQVRHDRCSLLGIRGEAHQIPRIQPLEVPAESVVGAGGVPRVAVGTGTQLERATRLRARVDDRRGGDVEAGRGVAAGSAAVVIVSTTAGRQDQRAGSSERGKPGQTSQVRHRVDSPSVWTSTGGTQRFARRRPRVPSTLAVWRNWMARVCRKVFL